MSWTLNDALQECARNTYNAKTMVQSGGAYAGKGLEYATRFLSGINYAINMVSRRKIGVMHTETVALPFNLADLTYRCLRVRSVMIEDQVFNFTINAQEDVTVEGLSSGSAEVTYEYLPAELGMTDLSTVLPIDERYIDPRVLCQYANYQFLSEEGTEYDSARAQVWLGLFTDSFESLGATNRLPKRVRYNG